MHRTLRCIVYSDAFRRAHKTGMQRLVQHVYHTVPLRRQISTPAVSYYTFRSTWENAQSYCSRETCQVHLFAIMEGQNTPDGSQLALDLHPQAAGCKQGRHR